MMGDRMKNFETTTAIPWSELYFSHQNLRYINAPWKEVLHIGKERVYKKILLFQILIHFHILFLELYKAFMQHRTEESV